jgi:hypothetical protein
MSARSRSIQSLRHRGTESEWRVGRRAVTESVGSAFGSVFASFGRAHIRLPPLPSGEGIYLPPSTYIGSECAEAINRS